MIMLVRSKHADIAVLRTMGAGAGSIIRVFLMTGASIGIIGTLAGTVLGLLFCWKIGSIQGFIESISGAELFAAEIYFLSTLPALVNPTEVGLVTTIFFFVTQQDFHQDSRILRRHFVKPLTCALLRRRLE